MYVSILLAPMYICAPMYAWCLRRSEEGIRFPEMGIIGQL